MLPDKVKPNLSAPTDDAALKAHFAAGNWGYYSHKIDGIRCLGHNGKAYSRKGLLIPNAYVQEAFATGDYDGFDGELVVGAASDPDVYRKTYSGVMSEHGEPDFCFHVFGVWNDLSTKFKDLSYAIRLRPRIGSVELVKQVTVHSYEQLAECEAESLQLGYEGGMYRWSEALYKYGRSTKKEMGIMKIKRFEEDDLVVLGFECAYRNDNEAVEDNLGYTKRSSHKENLVPIERVGKFLCRMPDGTVEKVATGNFNHEALEDIWRNKEAFVGKTLKVKHFSHGVKDKLRHARAVHWRADID